MSTRRSLSHAIPGSPIRPGMALPPNTLFRASLTASPAFADHLAGVIHDQVLQSLGLALLQTELCRRLWENGQGEDAGAELSGVVQELEAAVDALRGVMADLRVAADAHVRAS
jgi:Histidine kinase